MAHAKAVRHVFLTGPPGVGKTTLIMSLIDQLKAQSIRAQGFYTEEVRNGQKRIGFDVVTLDGNRGVLSRVGGRQGPQVGQYVVDLQSFERLALPVLNQSTDSIQTVLVIDEIGKMELFSQAFIQAVRKLLQNPSITLIGTIPVPKGKPLGLVEEIRKHKDVHVFMISKSNRDTILADVLDTVLQCLRKDN